MQQIEMAFDYGSLDSETRIVVQQRTTEVRETMRALAGLVRQTAETVWTLGEKLADVQQRLAPGGQFAAWCASELPGVSRGTIYNALNVHRAFPELPTVGSEFDIPLKALYLLAAPSTPDEARQEAIERAAAGETITHTAAQEIKQAHTLPHLPLDYPEIHRQIAPFALLAMDSRSGEFRIEVAGLEVQRFPHDAWDDAKSLVAELVAAFRAVETDDDLLPFEPDDDTETLATVAAPAAPKSEPKLSDIQNAIDRAAESIAASTAPASRIVVVPNGFVRQMVEASARSTADDVEDAEAEQSLPTLTPLPASSPPVVTPLPVAPVTLTPLAAPFAAMDASAHKQACALIAALEAAIVLAREGINTDAYAFPAAQTVQQARAILDAPQVKLAAWGLSMAAQEVAA